jgi:hypothetical protein
MLLKDENMIWDSQVGSGETLTKILAGKACDCM